MCLVACSVGLLNVCTAMILLNCDQFSQLQLLCSTIVVSAISVIILHCVLPMIFILPFSTGKALQRCDPHDPRMRLQNLTHGLVGWCRLTVGWRGAETEHRTIFCLTARVKQYLVLIHWPELTSLLDNPDWKHLNSALRHA